MCICTDQVTNPQGQKMDAYDIQDPFHKYGHIHIQWRLQRKGNLQTRVILSLDLSYVFD